MKTAYYIKEDKSNVQDYYVYIILESLKRLGYETVPIESNTTKKISKDSCLVLISHYSVLKYYLKGFRNIIYWVQGSSPDESYMRNKSHIRKFIISCIEYFALEKAKYVFMVSKGMLNHYKKKYHKDYSYKTYIMPCYNSEIQKELFMTNGKYNKNTFCYVGGLSVWQCFPETVALYKQIEDKIPNVFFKVFTGDQEKARLIIEAHGVKNYEVSYVNPNQLVNELASCKFGFIVREKSPVNYVATPTKLSNYMAAGVIPIVSNTVSFFNEILGKSDNAIILDGVNDVDNIVRMINKEINANYVFEDFKNLFDRFYNNDFHIANISEKIKKNML